MRATAPRSGPSPATMNHSSGSSLPSTAKASTATENPFRGSSRLTNSSRRPGGSSAGGASWNMSTSTPFGTIRARLRNGPVPNSAAASETPIITSSLDHTRRRTGVAIRTASFRSDPAWKVATTGPGALSAANIDVLGLIGSWTCTTSGRNARSSRRTRAQLRGSGQICATDRLNLTFTDRPTIRTPGSAEGSRPGASTSVRWPRSRRWAASCRTWV